MSKKNKTLSLRTLILLPNILDNHLQAQLTSNLAQQLGDEIENLRTNIVIVIDTNIKRLESVRNKIIQSTVNGKSNVLVKVDTMLKFLKHKKPDAAGSDSKSDLIKISNEIQVLAEQNDVLLGELFDNKKESKREKYYREQIKNLNEFEDRLFSTKHIVKVEYTEKIIDKGYKLIEQLRHEEAKEKSKAETKILRRELDNCFKEIKKAIR